MNDGGAWVLLMVTYGPVAMFFGWLWCVVLIWARGLIVGDQLAHDYFLDRPQHQTDVRRHMRHQRRRSIIKQRRARQAARNVPK